MVHNNRKWFVKSVAGTAETWLHVASLHWRHLLLGYSTSDCRRGESSAGALRQIIAVGCLELLENNTGLTRGCGAGALIERSVTVSTESSGRLHETVMLDQTIQQRHVIQEKKREEKHRRDKGVSPTRHTASLRLLSVGSVILPPVLTFCVTFTISVGLVWNDSLYSQIILQNNLSIFSNKQKRLRKYVHRKYPNQPHLSGNSGNIEVSFKFKSK